MIINGNIAIYDCKIIGWVRYNYLKIVNDIF